MWVWVMIVEHLQEEEACLPLEHEVKVDCRVVPEASSVSPVDTFSKQLQGAGARAGAGCRGNVKNVGAVCR